MPNHTFHLGQKVIYVNEFGVCFGVKTITELVIRDDQPCYHYEGSDTPWFPTNESEFRQATDSDLNASTAELQLKYGFETTKEQRAALLDLDPWEGEA